MWLTLQWARFFTLAGWDWKLDFQVTFPCAHSECAGTHSLLVRVVEKNFEELAKAHQKTFSAEEMYTEPHPALFGNGPTHTFWHMQHGPGGGSEDATRWAENAVVIWEQAAHN